MAQILELFFNRQKSASCFETACFKPSQKSEVKSGELFLFGEIRNSPKKGSEILNRLIKTFEQGHYQETTEDSLAEIFKKTIEKANEFLLETPKKEGFNLGGNLSFSALALSSDLSLTATRLTSVKMFLLRSGQITALGDNFPPTTNNLFANTLEGQTKENDKIIVFSKELAGIFDAEKMLSLLASLNTLKEIKKLIKKHQKALKESVGSCLIILVKKESNLQLPSFEFTEHNRLYKFFQKILPHSPALKPIVFKIIISLITLAILLPLGYFLFHR